MNRIRIKLLFVCLNVLLLTYSYGQSNGINTLDVGLKKNVVYGTLGLGALNGNYERMFGKLKKGSLWIRTGYGIRYGLFEDSETFFAAGLTGLTGSGKKHMEFNFGFLALKNTYDGTRRTLAGAAVGYRLQKPNGNYIFRTGIGYPEIIYASFGFCF